MTQDKGVVYRDNLDIDIKYDLSTLKNYKLVQPGDFIISLRSFQGGFETSYLTGITSPAYTIFNFIDNQDKDHAFWQYLFKRIDFINSLKRVTFGIRDGKAISFSQFGDVKVKYPSFNEQKHIATALTKLDNTIQLHERKCEELALIKKALLQKLFPKKDEVRPEVRYKNFSDAWEQRRLGEVADVRDGTHDSPKYINEGYPLLTSKNVGDGYINYDDVKYVSENDYVQINKRSKVDVNDILMGMIGTIGNLALIREEPDFAIKNVALIKHTSNFDYQFLFQELQTSAISKELLSGMDGGTQKFVSLKKIRNLSVMLPSENEQKKIGSYLMRFDSLIALHQRKLEKLKQLKKFLLQNMFI
ncbi:restriction endonuclease subunit S [Ligilactobacillus salivarius]|uniref:restriction endonuclease subunit S n=2 Tax=Ligilactobacillus salivarius TaxID=1624 RepID=UPI00117A4580|nr:restriction endonuclease subunit S [Ligilactobacillus salivarius]